MPLPEPATIPTPDIGTRERAVLSPTFFVVCWNDPVNLMTYVTHVFMKVFGWDKTKAEKHMLEVHEKGKSVLVREGPAKVSIAGDDGAGGMKLVEHKAGRWQYLLNPIKADMLLGLLNGFPFTGSRTAVVTRGDRDPETRERNALLTEALASHQQELEKCAAKILAQVTQRKNGWDLSLEAENREILLQILNEIRIGCWHALGAPEALNAKMPIEPRQLAFRNWMDLAGYFEQSLIEPEK